MEAKEANQVSLEEILSTYNRKPVRSYAGYDMYLSPFREETHPSFQVILSNNTWKDFGSGEFGSAVDLVMKKEACSFYEAMKIFDEKKYGSDLPLKPRSPKKEEEVKKAYQINKIAPLQNKILLSYMRDQRGIDPDVAAEFCKEVYYKRDGTDKNLFAIAFINDSGGMEYRNGAGYKGAFINKDITTIENSSGRCAIFEGFMDFLTYRQIMKGETEKLNINYVILNSVALVDKALPFLSRHESINCFLDNDAAGIAAFNKINRIVPLAVNEAKCHYPKYKDLNDFWTDQLKKKEIMVQSPDKKLPEQSDPLRKKGIKLPQ